MNHSISTKDKQTFLRWFVNRYRLKKRECVWILHYLLNHPHVLKHIHFVHDITHCPRGMMITSVCSKKEAFLFYKHQVVTTDAEKAFHDIRLNKEEPLYIQLQFKQANQNVLLAGILEENPFLKHEHFITDEDKMNAKSVLQHSIYTYQKQILLSEIDRALDVKNKKLFTELVDQLRALKVYDFNQPVLQRL